MFIFASFSDEVQSIYIFILTGELQKLATSESDTSPLYKSQFRSFVLRMTSVSCSIIKVND